MLVNLTPHSITILQENHEIWMVVPPSGVVARVKTTRGGTFPFFKTEYGAVENLPEPEKGVVFIVSLIVRSHPSVRDRNDVFSPGELVRDGAGQPKGCIGLTR